MSENKVQKHNGGSVTEDDKTASETYVPKAVVKRVNALKNIQLKMVDIETKFYEELHLLECRYAKEYEQLYDQRGQIVNGKYEPTEEETKWKLDGDESQNKSGSTTTEGVGEESPEMANIKGIPDFWLHAMKSTDIIGSAIQDHDEPVLKHLTDIRVKLNDSRPYGYTLEFHFNDNEFFTNKVLTKTYELTTDKDEKDPFGYDGPALYKSVGCKIEWTKGNDVTVKMVKKKQKHKTTGTVRVVTKEEKQDSFFNFFESPTPDGIRPSYKLITSPSSFNKSATDVEEELDEESEELYEADFEIGHFFKEFLIPKAVLYYTGELVDEAEYDDEDYEDEDEEDEDALKDISSIKNEEDDDDDDEEEEEEEEEQGNRKKPANQKGQHPKGKNPKA